MIDDPGILFPRYCEHGKLCDDYCEKCEQEEAVDYTDPQATPAERYPYLPDDSVASEEAKP